MTQVHATNVTTMTIKGWVHRFIPRNITMHRPCHSRGICCDVPSQTLTGTQTLSGTQTPPVNPNPNTLPKHVLSYVTSVPIQCSPGSSSFHDIYKLKHMPYATRTPNHWHVILYGRLIRTCVHPRIMKPQVASTEACSDSNHPPLPNAQARFGCSALCSSCLAECAAIYFIQIGQELD
jgi:hypothetical protein